LKIQGVFSILPIAGRNDSLNPASVDVCQPPVWITIFAAKIPASLHFYNLQARAWGTKLPTGTNFDLHSTTRRMLKLQAKIMANRKRGIPCEVSVKLAMG
jgi:hypothetical protein